MFQIYKQDNATDQQYQLVGNHYDRYIWPCRHALILQIFLGHCPHAVVALYKTLYNKIQYT